MDEPREAFKIVIADDSPLYRKLLQDTLAREQYCVLAAKNGSEALALVAEHKPAVLITDWEMPDITGTDLCARVRRDRDSYTHAILLTSNAEKEHIVAGLAAGADDYLTKPFHEGELLARVAVGIRMAELHREIQAKNRMLEELALTDSLTGLPNRRAFEDWAERALQGAKRHGFPFWVVMADLDHFKNVNDTYGHEAGDLVLRRFGEILKAHTRSANICARLGGEEFVMALSHVERMGIEVPVERIREHLQRERFDWQGGALVVSASFGVARLRDGMADLHQLLREADAALYLAKDRGRNRIEFAP
jgi:diguanylate cyclase (GGDEF)-like protein